MAKIKLYDYKGRFKNEIDIPLEVKGEGFNVDLINQYLRTYLFAQRQGTVKVKNKSEVRGGGRKPWQQKGTGRARVGSSRSPLWTGGGVIHGPTPRDWQKSFPKKMKKSAFQYAINKVVANDSLSAFEYLKPEGSGFSTKTAESFLKTIDLSKKVLIIHDKNSSLYKSFRNIKFVSVKEVSNLSVFDLLSAKSVVIEKDSVSMLQERMV
ncbi:50S ribosomal protein L4 [candidate division WWE3 bacterium CG_4_9_14_3_um_filter_34_6]|uniref:Large ribosomal subunit protein uL4 n=1 Tax=candidate division WWE3 bacterium CG_4_9_14_3_um_filter_34_6 TaxID=1975079 RepID=A0A2M7X379_UNCKA|nr:MAG: 50S ribosomal protein L4 [candidate division WWE3 bacterium CG_4_9_14_3_um_filter_34_6]